MLGIIGLSGGELILIFLVLMVPVIAVALGLSIYLLTRKSKKESTPPRPPAPPPTGPPARKRTPWVLLGCLVVGVGVILLFLAIHNKTSTADFIPPSKFLDLVSSNRIVEATLSYSPKSPLYEIIGTYRNTDGTNNPSISRFTERMALSDNQLDQVEALPNVEVKEQNTLFLPIVMTLLPLLLLLLFLGLVVFVIILVIRLATRNHSAPRAPPPITPAVPAQPAPGNCPKCGVILKPDVPEGLCPACLLQHGIATEGGAPPGTPSFTPPPLSELAKLFPQLEILEMIGQGGMGAVYKARQPSLDRFVALKILAPRSGGDLDFAGRFSREARALAKLSHPNIVGVYDYGTIGQASHLSPSQQSEGKSEMGKMPVLHYFIM